jgi:hypothetical protein
VIGRPADTGGPIRVILSFRRLILSYFILFQGQAKASVHFFAVRVTATDRIGPFHFQACQTVMPDFNGFFLLFSNPDWLKSMSSHFCGEHRRVFGGHLKRSEPSSLLRCEPTKQLKSLFELNNVFRSV